MKILSIVVLLLVSNLSFASNCKHVDAYFTNAVLIKFCMGAVMNDPDTQNRAEVFKKDPNCVNASNKINPNIKLLQKMDKKERTSCLQRHSLAELSRTNQMYTFYQQLLILK